MYISALLSVAVFNRLRDVQAGKGKSKMSQEAIAGILFRQ